MSDKTQPELPLPPPSRPLSGRWQLRDFVAAAGLFLATAAVVLWQNSHVAILWDASYTLDSATRIAIGQMPYRDFPFVHAPLTFLIQAAIIRLTGRVFFHHILYAAIMGGLGAVLTWRIMLRLLRGRLHSAWLIATLLAAPLAFLGIYSILPFPSYDCDCAFAILVAVWCLMRLDRATASPPPTQLRGFAAGCAVCVPLFVKQNMGLPFLLAALISVALLMALSLARRIKPAPSKTEARTLSAVAMGAATALAVALLALHFTAGLQNYFHWTIEFAGQRRLPGFASMAGVYREPTLLWSLPAIAVAVMLLSRRNSAGWPGAAAAFLLFAAPFVYALSALWRYTDDADTFGDLFLSVWPLLLLLAAALFFANIFRSRPLTLHSFLPFILLAAIHGTFLSQQLWGSTYAIWPLLLILIAEMLGFLAQLQALRNRTRWFVPSLAALVCLTLVACGAFYTASEERLSYVNLPDGPVMHSAFPQMAGASTPGPYLPEFDELLRYAAANIPQSDGIILMPGEDPFYFVTGRTPQFPVLMFDRTTDPNSPKGTAALARARNIRWLIVKRDLQLNDDASPGRAATLAQLLREFALVSHLRGYDIYKRP